MTGSIAVCRKIWCWNSAESSTSALAENKKWHWASEATILPPPQWYTSYKKGTPIPTRPHILIVLFHMNPWGGGILIQTTTNRVCHSHKRHMKVERGLLRGKTASGEEGKEGNDVKRSKIHYIHMCQLILGQLGTSWSHLRWGDLN